MKPIPEFEHTCEHGGLPIALGTPISLADLDARFKKHVVCIADKSIGQHLPDGAIQWGGFEQDCLEKVETLAEADGIWFACPLCYAKNGGPIGTHGVLVWFIGRGAPDRLGKNATGQTVRWNIAGGTGLNDLQLTPSIQLQGGGCGWHGFVGSSGVPPGFAG